MLMMYRGVSNILHKRFVLYLWYFIARVVLPMNFNKYVCLYFKKTLNNMYFTLTSAQGEVIKFWSLGALSLHTLKRKRSKQNFVELFMKVRRFVKVKKLRVRHIFLSKKLLRLRRLFRRHFRSRVWFVWLVINKPHNGLRGKKLKRR